MIQVFDGDGIDHTIVPKNDPSSLKTPIKNGTLIGHKGVEFLSWGVMAPFMPYNPLAKP